MTHPDNIHNSARKFNFRGMGDLHSSLIRLSACVWLAEAQKVKNKGEVRKKSRPSCRGKWKGRRLKQGVPKYFTRRGYTADGGTKSILKSTPTHPYALKDESKICQRIWRRIWRYAYFGPPHIERPGWPKSDVSSTTEAFSKCIGSYICNTFICNSA